MTALDLTPALPAERWLELAHSDHRLAAEIAIQALARLAVAQNDWTRVDPLIDLERPTGMVLATWAADVLNHRPAADRLLARAIAHGPEMLAMALRPLERLGLTDLRARLTREHAELYGAAFAIEIPSTEVAMLRRGASIDIVVRMAKPSNAALEPFDRSSGGDLAVLRTVADVLGEDLLPAALVDALRRRDPDATAAQLRALAETPSPFPADRRAEHASRLALAKGFADLLRQSEPRREKFDRAAALALPHAVLAAALARGGSRAALAGRIFGDTPVWTLADRCDNDTAAALARIDPEGRPSLAAALLDGACAWSLEALAPTVLRACAARTLRWVFETMPLALRLEPALLAALPPPETITEGEAALLTSLPSRAAAARSAELVDTPRYGIRALQGVLACAFPTPELLARSQRASGLSHAELTERLELLTVLGAPPLALDPARTILHCRCGHLWNMGPEGLVDYGAVWPDPPLPCPACHRPGDAVAWLSGEALPPLKWASPEYPAASTPRLELEKFEAEADPVAAADLLDLAGESARADALLAQVPDDGRKAYPDALARILLRRGRLEEAFELCTAALADAGELLFLDDDALADVRTALALSAARLGRPVPSATAPPPAAIPALPHDVGRNAPCPCGSGKKYKRCHGS
jgi:hypothetical protein